MTYLPRLASVEQACSWLAVETNEAWTLQRLMEYRLRPYFWLEHDEKLPRLSNNRLEGVMAEMVFGGDLQRLEFDGHEPFVTMFRTEDGTLCKSEPGFKLPLHELRFKRQEIEETANLVNQRKKPREAALTPREQNLEKRPFTVHLEEGKVVKFCDLAHIIAKAMYPSDADLGSYGITRLTLDDDLLEAVKTQELTVRNPAGMGAITWVAPSALKSGVLLPSELGAFLGKRGIGLVLLPHGSGPIYWTIENAAQDIAKQESLHSGACGTLLDAMVDAANARELTVRDPHTCLPFFPLVARQFYELVTHGDVNKWLEQQGTPYRWRTVEATSAYLSGAVILNIGGRSALPVRALPYVTSWNLSPDEVAGNLARKTGAHARLQNTSALHLVGDMPTKMLANEWDAFVVQLDALKAALSNLYQGEEDADSRRYADWRQRSASLLPAGVFVWLDDFHNDHQRDFSPEAVTYTQERGGERELNLSPYMDAQALAMVMEGFDSVQHSASQSIREAPLASDLIAFTSWYDATLSASYWWGLSDLQPAEAAMLLCEQDPHEEPTPERTTTSETTPLDYRKLLRAFTDVAKREPSPRTLSVWHKHARAERLKYHSWIDRYASAVNQSGDWECDKTAASFEMQGAFTTPPNGTPSVARDGITAAQVAAIFDALPYTAENWTKRLSDTKWLQSARVSLGAAGGATSLWCPATLARLIHGKARAGDKQKTLEALNRKFRNKSVLAPWRTDWDDHYAVFNDADEHQ
ncbi:hypothetical protein [Acidovorax sp. Leaf78]|uniref:hypothetical protein n=1 Tax=Acidovorax sp. Leaf78 TaxID=1736237 RepID=UPI001F1E281E|nr:hypothetical protein [Acidovorax sp. Leaf78]